jgi:MoaD family protein
MSEVEVEGQSVGEVLRALAAEHPETSDQLFSGDGELNRYVNVYVNDEDVRVQDGLDTAVDPGDTVVILPAMAGGEGRRLRGAVWNETAATDRGIGRH